MNFMLSDPKVPAGDTQLGRIIQSKIRCDFCYLGDSTKDLQSQLVKVVFLT